jgi:tRNA A37 threonylcarbamoyladenosine biosynthesis protein TsaE
VRDDSVALIEWAERLGPLLPEASIEVDITVTGEETRRIRLTPHSERHSEMIDEILTQ